MVAASQHKRDRRGGALTRRSVLASQDRFWTPSDLKLSPSTAHHLLGELEDDGELRRIRRGLYWRGVKTPLGMAPPSIEQLTDRLAPGPGVGPSGLSAANALRLSTQVPRRAQVAVPGRGPADVGPVTFVSRAARKRRSTLRLSATEVALLEVLADWPAVVELEPSSAIRQVVRLLLSGTVRPDRLAKSASTEPGQTRARLKVLLAAADMPDLVVQVPPADRRTEAAAAILLLGE